MLALRVTSEQELACYEQPPPPSYPHERDHDYPALATSTLSNTSRTNNEFVNIRMERLCALNLPVPNRRYTRVDKTITLFRHIFMGFFFYTVTETFSRFSKTQKSSILSANSSEKLFFEFFFQKLKKKSSTFLIAILQPLIISKYFQLS